MPEPKQGDVRSPDPQQRTREADAAPAGDTDPKRDADGGTPPDPQKRDAARTEDDWTRMEGALRSERERAKELRGRVEELEGAGRSELERATRRAETAEKRAEEAEERTAEVEREGLARTIAAEAGIAHLWHRLQGDDTRQLRADASRLREEMGMEGGVLDGGARGAGAPNDKPPDMDTIIRRRAGR